MGIQTKTESKKVMKNGVRQADAWLNLSVVDKNGKSHKLGGIPLNDEHYLTKAFIAKSGIEVGENADIDIQVTANLSRVDHNPTAIEL
jgi:hypothetical protein